MIRNEIPSYFLFCGITRNGIPKVFLFRETGGIPTKQWSVPSCFDFRGIFFWLEIGSVINRHP
jgi:hypothetical protein